MICLSNLMKGGSLTCNRYKAKERSHCGIVRDNEAVLVSDIAGCQMRTRHHWPCCPSHRSMKGE